MGAVRTGDFNARICVRLRKGRSIVVHLALLIACAVTIYLSREWFVNAVEWLGQRLNIGTMAASRS
jgi:hypothetical protein